MNCGWRGLSAAVFAALLSGCVFVGPPADEPDELDVSKISDADVCYALTPVGSVGRGEGPIDLGAITYVAGDTYWAASDSGGRVCELTVPVDRVTGRVQACRCGRILELEDRVDLEGLAFDPLHGLLWAADESRRSVTGHRLVDGKKLFDVDLPECYRRCRSNLALESLSVREDGLEMWTCNEGPLTGDGDESTKSSKSLVRLTRFSRTDGAMPWRPAGQWAYPIGRLHGGPFRGVLTRGVSDLCVLPDGTLLSLEREFSWNVLPCFRCRVYQVFFSDATDVSARATLTDADIVPVARRRLWADDTVFSNYEGMCLGPQLADGSRVLLLVSDGGGHAGERLYSFKLSVASEPRTL